jgi:hypothetical protein
VAVQAATAARGRTSPGRSIGRMMAI